MSSNHSFVAYIDESGDEGFRIPPHGQGSSRWLILAAVVTSVVHDRGMVDVMRDSRALLGKPEKYNLHFRKLSHPQRLGWVNIIAEGRMKTIVIACHKPDMTRTAFLRQKHRLYFYLTRFLLERISWLCRDSMVQEIPGDGSVRLVFSNRSSMSYSEIGDYLARLTTDESVNIEWSIVRADQIMPLAHHARAGLQIADAVASSYFHAFEGAMGYPDPGYARVLIPLAYRYRDRLRSYGVKVFPDGAGKAVHENPEYEWLK